MKKMSLGLLIVVSANTFTASPLTTSEKTKECAVGLALTGVTLGTAVLASASAIGAFMQLAVENPFSCQESTVDALSTCINKELTGKSTLAASAHFPLAFVKAVWQEKKSVAKVFLFGIISAALWSTVPRLGKLAEESFAKVSSQEDKK